MLNLKKEEIKTMDRDLAFLQGKKGFKPKAGGTALQETALEPGLERRLLQAFSSSRMVEEEPESPQTSFSAPLPPPPPLPPLPPMPPMPETPPEPPSLKNAEKELEKKISDQVDASMPESALFKIMGNAVITTSPQEKVPAPPKPAKSFLDETQPIAQPKAAENKPENKIETKEEAPEKEKTGDEKEAEIKQGIQNALSEKVEAERLASAEAKDKEEEERKTQELAEKIARDKEKKELAEEEGDRLKRKPDLVLPVLLKEAKERLHSDRKEIEKQLSEFEIQDEPLESQKLQLMAEVELSKTGELGLIIGKEKEVEEEKNRLETQKKGNLTLEQEKTLSQKLWEIEDKRKQIERRRWEVEDQITRKEIEIKKIELELEQKNKERERVASLAKKISAKEKLIDFIGIKKTRLKDAGQVKEEIGKLTPDTELLAEEKRKTEDTLKELTESEKAIIEELKMVEEKEAQAVTPDEKRVIEKMRWKVEAELRITTKDKWQSLIKKEKIEAVEKENLSRIERQEKTLKEIEDKITADEIVLEKEGINVRRIRDEVGKIFEENGFEFDPDVLNDIPQDETGEGLSGGESAYDEETWVPKEKNAETPAQELPVENDAIPETETAAEVKDEQKIQKTQPPQRLKTSYQEPPAINSSQRTATSAPAAAPYRRELVDKTPSAFDRPGSFLEPVDQKPAEPSSAFSQTPEKTGGDFPDPADRWQPPESADAKPQPAPLEPITEDNNPPNPWENRWAQAAKQPAETLPKASPAPLKPQARESAELDDFPLTDDLPAKSGGNKKLLIRLAILLVCFAVLGAVFLIVFSKKKTPADTGKTPVETPAAGDDSAPSDDDSDDATGDDDTANSGDTANGDDTADGDSAPPVLVEPASLITTISTHTIRTDDVVKNLSDQLSPYLQRKFEGEGYYRILIEDSKNNNYAGLKEFFSAFGVKAPGGLLDHLNNDFTLFIYASGGDNRLGFVAEITDPAGFGDIAKNWESTMEKDSNGLLKFLGKTASASPSFFKTATVPNSKTTFRYLSFALPPSNKNSGLCYAATDKYYVFTTSGESLIKIFNQLKK